jgi:hypothetical protein
MERDLLHTFDRSECDATMLYVSSLAAYRALANFLKPGQLPAPRWLNAQKPNPIN